MQTKIRFIFVSGMALLLSACGMSTTSTIGTKYATTHEKLANGKPLAVGMLRPTEEWNCDQTATNSYKWSMLQFEGQFKSWTGGDGLLRKNVVAYANNNHIKTNYVYFSIPDTTSINGVNLSALTDTDKVNVIYYQCGKVLA